MGCVMTVSCIDRQLYNNKTETVSILNIRDEYGKTVYNTSIANKNYPAWYYLTGAELIYCIPDSIFYRLVKIHEINKYILEYVTDVRFVVPEHIPYGYDPRQYNIPPIHLSGQDFLILNMPKYPKYYCFNQSLNKYEIFDLNLYDESYIRNNIEYLQTDNYIHISSEITNIKNENGISRNILIIRNTEKKNYIKFDVTDLLTLNNKHTIYDLVNSNCQPITLSINNTQIDLINVNYTISNDNTKLIVTNTLTGCSLNLDIDNKKNNNNTKIRLRSKNIKILDYIQD